ncbi:DHA2 family efflux MFS transporter permease subunit [Prescottella agglutinans]|uniref:DHA2 family efflux MFS transporter permease subunit n=1 Tax=Prescottella agglutinans TaxID=1644129 RepID=A0A3S3D1J3_9NOCA|nr:DHA2 family efflux MFS transporter permease subunit [Prescottella agglutinans]
MIVLGAFASGLDASIVNVGLDSISRSLGSSLAATQWVASGYLLALAVSLPLAGWLAHRYGSRRLWLASLAAFTVASIGCAAAPTLEFLIVARVLQGFAGGVLIPTGQTVLGQAVGPDRLGRVMGTLGIAVSAAPAIGSLLGGFILHGAAWPWLFLINIPIGVAGLLLGNRLLPRDAESPTTSPLHRTGLALISIGLPALVFAASRWGDAGHLTPDIVAAAGFATLTLAAFVAVTLRATHPLLDLEMFRVPGFRAGAVTAFFSGALIFGSGVLFALYFQVGRGQTPLDTGVSLLCFAGATAVTAPITGRWIDRRGPSRVALTGGVLAAAATAALTALPLDAPIWLIQPVLIVFGAAVNMVAMPAGITAYKSVSATHLPDAITQINILQRIGGSIGGAICAVFVASNQTGLATAFTHAHLALLTASLGVTTGALLIYRATRPARTPQPSDKDHW